MKKGTIVCISGNIPDAWSARDEADFRRRFKHYDAIQIVTPRTPRFLFNLIWMKMLSRGITDIFLARARFRKKGDLEVSEENIRLQMVGMS